MTAVAYLPIVADRYTPCVRTIAFKGLDLRGLTLRMQLRIAVDTPGVALVDLGSVANAQAQGLALLTVDDDGGLITSTLQIRISELTMEGLPYVGELGSPTQLAYDLITTIGGDKRVLTRGPFVIEGGVTGADNAPASRPYGYGARGGSISGMRTGATLTFGENRVEIVLDSADLVAPIAKRAEDAAAAAENDRASAAAERVAAEQARDQANISRDVATTAQPTYATQAAGESATAVGALFAVAPGDGTAQMRRRTPGGSDYLYDFQTTKFRSARGGNPRLIPLAQRLGAQAFITEYVVGDGNADDSDAYQAAQENGNVREWLYPEGCSIALTRTVNWLGERTHRFANNARIVAEVEGYGVRGLGYPDQIAAIVQNPIPRDSMSFVATNASDLSAGDDFYLYDVSREEYDINVVRKKVGDTVYTKRPINFFFENPSDVRVYKLVNACRNINVFGGEFRNVLNSLNANGLGFLAATDIFIRDSVAAKTGGIGIGFEVSMRFATDTVAAIETGAVGMGHRNVKDFTHRFFIGRRPQRDESLTFFKSCTNGEIVGPDIEQYLIGEAPAGNTGLSGNCILLDERCDFITIRDARLSMSTTYPIFINNGSRRNKIINPDIQLANLGGVRIALNSHDNVVEGGHIRDIIDEYDAEVAPAPGLRTAAIQDDATCSGNVLGEGTRVSRIAGGVAVRQAGVRGLIIHNGDADYRGGKLAISTSDWDATARIGTRLVAQPAVSGANAYLRVFGESKGGTDYAAVSISAAAASPADLVGVGDVVVAIPDGQPYVTYRGFDGVTKTMPAPLGAQLAAQEPSTAATVEGLRADFNALLANMRTAKLLG
ncbi:hypothetical protein [Sphingomonas beigongshangi]|uniref:hypothetical protein n=1 Tax=Sphingomonas beigongshangi TaxID=2782540 RepID=UPI00193B1254|nr:hypothetical protein [Sphingomonas beigongshangi]